MSYKEKLPSRRILWSDFEEDRFAVRRGIAPLIFIQMSLNFPANSDWVLQTNGCKKENFNNGSSSEANSLKCDQ